MTQTKPDSHNRSSVPALQHLLLFLVALVVIVLDQASKYLIEARMPLNTTYAPIPALEAIFRITHVSNTGAAFGLFAQGGVLFMLVAAVVSVVIILYNFSLPRGFFLLRAALGLQLGGALGNLIDRIRLGHVTDFLDFGPWPVFNLADTSIVAGVVILGVLMLLEQRREAAAAAANQDSQPSGNKLPGGGSADFSPVVLPSSGFEEIHEGESRSQHG